MVKCVPVENKNIDRYNDLRDLVPQLKNLLPNDTIQDVKNDYVEIRFSPAHPNKLMKIICTLIYNGFSHISYSHGCIRAFFDDAQSFEVLR